MHQQQPHRTVCMSSPAMTSQLFYWTSVMGSSLPQLHILLCLMRLTCGKQAGTLGCASALARKTKSTLLCSTKHSEHSGRKILISLPLRGRPQHRAASIYMRPLRSCPKTPSCSCRTAVGNLHGPFVKSASLHNHARRPPLHPACVTLDSAWHAHACCSTG